MEIKLHDRLVATNDKAFILTEQKDIAEELLVGKDSIVEVEYINQKYIGIKVKAVLVKITHKHANIGYAGYIPRSEIGNWKIRIVENDSKNIKKKNGNENSKKKRN